MIYLISMVVSSIFTMLCVYVGYDNIDAKSLVIAISPTIVLFFLIVDKIKKKFVPYLCIIVWFLLLYGLLRLYKYIVIDEFSVTIIVYFIIQIVFAALSPKTEQNSYFGIRTPFTLDYKEIWDKTHVFVSIAETITIPIMFALIFFLNGWLRFGVGTCLVLLPLIYSVLYSNVIGTSYHKIMMKKEREELKKQEALEQQGVYICKKQNTGNK